MSTASGKDVIYIDVDDEITTIIDKVRGSGQKIVALVLPKRATVFQSVVNMKLLKRTADEAKKNMVLITSEAGLLPLAGSVGLHVAKSLQSKPEVPDAPLKPSGKLDTITDDDADDIEDVDDPPIKSVDKTKSVGELAGAAAIDSELDDDEDDHIELDDEADGDSDADAPIELVAAGKVKKNKKLKIPNFNKFRLWLVLGGVGIVALIVLGYLALVVMPRASIVIKTDSTAVDTDSNLTLKPGDAVTLDAANGVVPAHAQQVQKTMTQQVAASGQQNNGSKATGKVTLSLKDCSVDSITVPAGAGVTSGGLTFITQEPASMSSVKVGSQCKNSQFPSFSSATVDVTAQKAGAAYNLAAAAYAVPGFSTVAGSGTAMAGGTDDIIKIVLQSDIDSAKQKIASTDSDAIKQELQTDLTNGGFYPVPATFNTATPNTTSSVNAGDQADNVTVTQTVSYTMMGAHQTDLEKVLATAVAGKIDTHKQKISDYGLSGANFNLQDPNPDATIVAMHATVIAGPELHTDDLKKQVAGKKASEAQNIIKSNPGVTDVNVQYSPFWVGSIPKKTSKITITIEKPQTTQHAQSN